jgi:linoleoyl-CoA desaturase
MQYKVSFNNANKVFFNALKQSVEDYFKANNIKKTGNASLYIKTAILIGGTVALYFTLLYVAMPLFLTLLLCGLFGLCMAFIGFNIMHDANHGSFSSRKWVNEIFGLTLNFVGGNAFMWKLKHNIIHHTYTNIDGVDDDLNNLPFMRECKTQEWKPMHRFQGYYMFVLYGFTSISMWLADFTKYFSKKIYTTELKPMDLKEHLIFWITKAMYVTAYVVVPIMVVGWQHWLVGFSVMHFVLGLFLALVFQLAHVVEHAEFSVAGVEPVKIENEWAIHQVKTTANFAAKNKLITWLVGGLNFQIEHHLFPRISHVHYPQISKIVRETCEQFNIRYNYFPTMTAAVGSHFRIMNELGKKPDEMNY